MAERDFFDLTQMRGSSESGEAETGDEEEEEEGDVPTSSSEHESLHSSDLEDPEERFLRDFLEEIEGRTRRRPRKQRRGQHGKRQRRKKSRIQENRGSPTLGGFLGPTARRGQAAPAVIDLEEEEKEEQPVVQVQQPPRRRTVQTNARQCIEQEQAMVNTLILSPETIRRIRDAKNTPLQNPTTVRIQNILSPPLNIGDTFRDGTIIAKEVFTQEGDENIYQYIVELNDGTIEDIPRQRNQIRIGNEELIFDDYQLKNVNWMFTVYEESQKFQGRLGCILGDPVGTGKTIQAALLATNIRDYVFQLPEGQHPPRLAKILIVIAQEAQAANWMIEFERVDRNDMAKSQRLTINPSLIQTVDGLTDEQVYERYIGPICVYFVPHHFFRTGTSGRSQSYERFRQRLLRRIQWDCIILDEAHEIRNAPLLYKELNKLQSQFRVGLTATPIANRIDEIFCIYHWVAPGLLGKAEAIEHIKQLIDPLFSATLQKTSYQTHAFDIAIPLSGDVYDRNTDYTRYMQAKNRNLPALQKIMYLGFLTTYSKYPCPTKPKYIYTIGKSVDFHLQETDEYTIYRIDKKGERVAGAVNVAGAVDDNEGEEEEKETYEDNESPTLIRSFTYENVEYDQQTNKWKFKTNFDGQPIIDFGTIVNETIAYKTLNDELQEQLNHLEFSFPDSSKIKALLQILTHIDSQQESVLIFIRYLNYIPMLLQIFKQYDLFVGETDTLTGQVNATDRVNILQKFNEQRSIRCLIVTYGVGAVGFNLEAANHVILYNLDFKYLNTEQASGRIQRRTQEKKNVYVYRFVTPYTIEQGLAQLQDKKRWLNENLKSGELTKAILNNNIINPAILMTEDEQRTAQALMPSQSVEPVTYNPTDPKFTDNNQCQWQIIKDTNMLRHALLTAKRRNEREAERARAEEHKAEPLNRVNPIAVVEPFRERLETENIPDTEEIRKPYETLMNAYINGEMTQQMFEELFDVILQSHHVMIRQTGAGKRRKTSQSSSAVPIVTPSISISNIQETEINAEDYI